MPTTKRRPLSMAACCPSVLDAPLKERDAQQLASAFAALPQTPEPEPKLSQQ